MALAWREYQDAIFGHSFEAYGLPDGDTARAYRNAAGTFIAHAFIGGRYLHHKARSFASAMRRLDADVQRRGLT